MSYAKKRASSETYLYRIIQEAAVTVAAAGTPVLCPNNTDAVAVLVMNNNTDGRLVVVGLPDTVDAMSTPKIGRVLAAYDSTLVYVRENSSEVAIDADQDNTQVCIQILGV